VCNKFIAKAIVSLSVYDTQLQVRERVLGKGLDCAHWWLYEQSLEASCFTFLVREVPCRSCRNPVDSHHVSRPRANPTRCFARADARYKVRQFVVLSGYLPILLFLALLFEDRLGRLSFGAAGAGVAVALQDVLASIAGAFSIAFRSCTPWEIVVASRHPLKRGGRENRPRL
jgi:hypothetical protein